MSHLIVSSSKTSHDVASLLRTQIQSGELAIGVRLPAQRELSTQIGVGRQAVQNALSLLEAEGYITTKRGAHGGSIVSEPVATAAVWLALVRSNTNDLQDTFDFRLAVERQIVMLAAERRTDDDLAAMLQAIDDLPRTNTTRSLFREADGRFHAAMAAAAGNRRLEIALRQARADLFLPTDNIPFTETVEVTRRQHMAIYKAIEKQDPVAAARAIGSHIQKTRTDLFAVLVEGQ